MKNQKLIKTVKIFSITLLVLFNTKVNAQWSPTWLGNIPNWNAGGSGNSEPALQDPTPWALGGNAMFGMPGSWFGQINNAVNPLYRSASIGTVDDATFVMKANNRESIFIDPSSRVGIGWNNTGGSTAPINMWSDLNATSNQSRLSFFVDIDGNIESSESMGLLFSTNKSFNVKEGSVLGGSVPRITSTNGKCGINNASPQSALDVQASSSPSSFRIYGDAAGNVHSTTHMKLHYGITNNGAPEFQINNGDPGNATTRLLMNTWGTHFETGGTFNGIFIGPSASPWYNNCGSHRMWIDAQNSAGLAIVGGNGNQALNIFNGAGVIRFGMLINPGSGDDTKFDMRGSVQLGFYNSINAWEDPNARLNVAALNIGVKVQTTSSSTKAFLVENSNYSSTTSNAFVVYGDGKTQIGPNYADPNGVASNAMLSVNGLVLAKDVRIAVATGTHWKFPDFVFEKDYQLASLDAVEEYINKNKHLPNVPSEAEVNKDGMSLAEMDIKLLQKVEELFLYTIDLKKQNQLLEQKIEGLKQELKSINK